MTYFQFFRACFLKIPILLKLRIWAKSGRKRWEGNCTISLPQGRSLIGCIPWRGDSANNLFCFRVCATNLFNLSHFSNVTSIQHTRAHKLDGKLSRTKSTCRKWILFFWLHSLSNIQLILIISSKILNQFSAWIFSRRTRYRFTVYSNRTWSSVHSQYYGPKTSALYSINAQFWLNKLFNTKCAHAL